MFLLPRPRSIEAGEDNCSIAALRPEVPAGLTRLAAGVERWRTRSHLLGESPENAATPLRFVVDAAAGGGSPEGYRLEIGPGRVVAAAPTETGLERARCTLEQWLDASRDRREPDDPHPEQTVTVPSATIEDRPAFATRGFLLDVSRNRVPTMQTLFELVDRLAALKINHLQLYTEHTFAYEGHERVWRGWSPLTPDEVEALDDYCHARFIELAPNQNSFGHLHRWLVHEPYRALAECPDGVEHPFSDAVEPFSLCATDPESLRFLEGLFDQLLPRFRSGPFNVGLDETFDLGRCRSRARCEEQGRGIVYLEFLEAVHRLVRERDRRMLFWGDIVLEHPELVQRLPEDVTALVWGYEADHDFDQACRRFAEAEVDHWVCPGTSSWQSFSGRADNALANLRAAARAGVEHGASGYLVTDWGDFGHLQPLPVSWLGIAAGADLGWNPESRGRDWPETIARHWLGAPQDDAALGLCSALVELGRVHAHTGAEPMNGAVLFYLLRFLHHDLTAKRYGGLSESGLATAADRLLELERRIATIAVEDGPRELPKLQRELLWVARMLRCCADLGRGRLEAGVEQPVAALDRQLRSRLRAELVAATLELTDVWLERSRPGGLEASKELLDRAVQLLV